MQVYAGIDEAGYGPLFGPLTVARSVLVYNNDTPSARPAANATHPTLPPCPWELLKEAICKELTGRQGRIAINDSKKLHTQAAGIAHLERGVLAFASLSGRKPEHLGELLTMLGERTHDSLDQLPWYAPSSDAPWQTLPARCEAGELAVARGMLSTACRKAELHMPDLAVAVVFEDRFNQMVRATRSKAATSFTFVSQHLNAIWQQFGREHPTVIVDRQSGRTHYRELLSLALPHTDLRIVEETRERSAYEITARKGGRAMTVSFEVDADDRHLPVALASMTGKYIRELLMARFQNWFQQRLPDVRPTAGYATDGKRFWNEVQPHLQQLEVDGDVLRRSS